MRKLIYAGTAWLFALLPFVLPAQISITTSGTTENFNAMGTSTVLPANWKMSSQGQGSISGYATSTNITSVTQVANSLSPTTGGAYNWGTTAGTDRAVGFMTSGAYTSPNSVMAYYRNTTGTTLTTLTVTFQIERYRINTATFSLAFSSSLNGSTWTTQPAGDIATTDFATGADAYTFATPQTVSKTVTISGLSLANNNDFYLRWVFTNTGNTNSQGLGLDDVRVVAPPVVTATLKDILSNDVNSDGLANPGDGLTYATTIKNAGPGNATNVTLSTTAPTNTTFVSGSVKTSPLARNDTFATAYNTALNGSTVLANDFGMPAPTVLSFGPTANSSANAAGASGTTDGGGTVSVQTNGTFTYTPANNFTGADKFAYKAGNGNLPDNDGFVVINVAPDITFSTVNVNPACNAGTTGSITFTASGGTGALMYSITGSAGTYQPSNVFTGLAAGTYNLAVKDTTGYIKTGMATLTQPTAISFTTTNVDPLCNAGTTGSITITATGGTGTLTYSKDNGVNYQASNIFSGLAAGTYNLVVKDASNCTKTGTATLNNPAAVNFTTSISNVLCNGGNTGSITVTAMGGVGTLTFSKDNGVNYQASNVFNNLTAATYNLVVKDANNCTKTGTASVTEPVVLVVNGAIPNLTYTVAMATVTFTTTGGTGTKTWSATGLPTGITIVVSTGALGGTPTQTGSFNAVITVMDANNCVATKNIAFTVAPKLTGDAYDAVGNTQLVADGYSVPSTPFTSDADNIITNDASDAAITITAVTNAATTNGGTISILSNGKFIYTPKAGSTTADTYVYTATSNGVSATATISFTVANMVWYVNNTNAGTADGRSNTPFANVASAATASAANQIIYIHTGTGNTTGNALLKSGQILRGAGTALSVAALSIPAGTKPTLTGMVTLASSVTVDGFDMNTAATTPLSSSGATGVTVNIGNVTSSGAVNAVSLTNTTGAVTIAGGTQTNSTGATFLISGGTVSLTYSGSIIQGANAAMVSVTGGHATGTITFQTGTLSATNGTGLQFDNADGAYNFNGAVTLNGGDAGIDIINGSGGNFSFVNAPITNPSGAAFLVNGGGGIISHTGTISKTSSGRLIDMQSRTGGSVTINSNLSSTGSSTGINVSSCTGGTVTFSGTTKTINTGVATAVTLATNAGATINFTNGGLDIDVTTATGFNATGGGTISVQGTGNSITAGTGTALNVNATTIGAGNLNFQSISANGATKGITLNTTGSGGLIVTGTGTTNGSGGTIQNIAQRGIEIISSSNLSLKNMALTNANQNDGVAPCGAADNSGCNAAIYLNTVTGAAFDNIDITGTTTQQGFNIKEVNNFTLVNSTIANAGTGGVNGEEGGIYALNLSGTSAITNTAVTQPGGRGACIYNISKTLALTVTGSSFNGTQSSTVGADGFEVSSFGTSNTTLDFVNSTFNNNKTNGLQVIGEDNSVTSADVTGCTMDYGGFVGGGGAIDFDVADNASFNFNIINNPTLKGALTSIVNIYAQQSGAIQGRVNGNNVNCASGSGSAIRAFCQESSNMKVEINGNTVTGVLLDNGIDVTSRAGNGRMDAIISNNSVTVGSATSTANANIRVAAGASGSTFTNKTCAWVKNNTISVANAFSNWELRVVGAHQVLLQGAGASMGAVWNANGNTPASPPAVMNPLVSGAGTILYGQTCVAPSNPLP